MSQFKKKLFETHCHLDTLQSLPVEDIVAKAHAEGVEKIVTIAVEPKNLSTVIALAQKFPQVYCTQGIHPHDAQQFNEEVEEQIRLAVGQGPGQKIVAIGEIGLDYYYEHSQRQMQWQVFERQLQLACTLNLPVVIHSRDADSDMISILKNYSQKLLKKGVIHSFTSGAPLAEFALQEGFYLGFNGIVTFKNAENVRQICQMTPLAQLLLETDSPYLTPVPHRGKENAPYYLPFVAQKVLEIKQAPEEIFYHTIFQNSCRLFGL